VLRAGGGAAPAPGASARTLELIALRLFTEKGFHETTVDEIATAAGVSRRTFFRYFDAKSEVLWSEFDSEVTTIRATSPTARTTCR
jgi:AcrR family transcriptional regulator